MQRIIIAGVSIPNIKGVEDLSDVKNEVWSVVQRRVKREHKVVCVVNDKLVLAIDNVADFLSAKNNYRTAKFFSVPSNKLPK